MPATRWCAVDFRTYEALSSLGWGMRVRSFQRLVVLIGSCGLVTAFAASTLVARWLLDEIESLGVGAGETESIAALANGSMAALAVVNVYVGAGLVVREWLSRRRHAVGMSANAAFFRALDLPATHIFLSHCVIRILAFTVLLGVADAGIAAVLAPATGTAGSWAVLSIPSAILAITLAVASANATRTVAVARIRPGGALCLVALAAGAGLAVAALLDRATAAAAGANFGTEPLQRLAEWWPYLTIAMTAATVAALCYTAWRLRRLSRRSFPLGGVDAAEHAPARPGWFLRRADAITPLWGAVHREVSNSTVLFALQRLHLAAAAVVVSIGSVVASEVVRSLRDSFQTPMTTAIIVIGFLLCATVTELLLAVAGPTRWRRHLRFAWENGASLRSIVGCAVGYPATQILAVGVAIMIAGWVALGHPVWPVLFVCLGFLFASLIAEAVSGKAMELTDGSTQASVFVALVSVLLTAPIVIGSLVLTGALVAVLPVAVVCLGGGAVACTARRIIALPSDVPV